MEKAPRISRKPVPSPGPPATANRQLPFQTPVEIKDDKDVGSAWTPRRSPVDSRQALRIATGAGEGAGQHPGFRDHVSKEEGAPQLSAGATPTSARTLAPPAYSYADELRYRRSYETLSTPPLPPRPRTATPSGSGRAPRLTANLDTPHPPVPTNLPAGASQQGHGKDKDKDKESSPSFWKAAFDETRFFAGGLIQKPYESSKHYTIMRHSGGLVMYRGPSTSVVVTVFAKPGHSVAPADRTVWLQRRGYSGDTGLRLKTLVGASGSWLDVTPGRQAASAAELPAADERGYQRDIERFLRKTRPGKHYDKSVAGRVPRETLVVRIPAACTDGYFRLVVCATDARDGHVQRKKVLCGSPVFRVASMSTDASIFRGASLSTMPLEAGVKIASLIGSRYVETAAAPVVGAVQDTVSRFQPGTVATMAAQTAFSESKLPAVLGAAGESYDAQRQRAYEKLQPEQPEQMVLDEDVPPEVVGDDAGPSKPWPVELAGRVVPGSGWSSAELGVPTANLADVQDDLRLRLNGVYFGWVSIVPGKAMMEAGARYPNDWVEALVVVSPPRKMTVVEHNEVSVHLLCHVDSSLVGAKFKVVLMGFLAPGLDRRTVATHAQLVVASLSRPAWGPQSTLALVDFERSGRSFSDRYADARGRLQKHVDLIPFHLAGVRTAGSEMRDQLYGNGGFWVAR